MSLLSKHKSTCIVLEFSFLEGPLSAPTLNQSNRFTDLESPISGFDPGEPDAMPDPMIRVKLPKYVPGMEEKHTKVQISDHHPLIVLMRREYSLPKISCRGFQYIFDTSTGLTGANVEQLFLFDGDCDKIISAPGGKKGVVEILVSNSKLKAKRPSGFLTSAHCGNTFGDLKTCKFDVAPLTETASVGAIQDNGFTLSLTGMSTPNLTYWIGGFVYYNGVRMDIRDWDGNRDFLLTQRISYEMSQLALPFTVEMRPGCRLVLQDCRFYGNEANFNALGINIPIHNPLFEKGGS